MTNNKAHWSYLAAIIDGEGTIAINKHNKPGRAGVNQSYAVEMTVVNTDKRLMDFLIKNFGGQYYTRPSRDPRHKPAMAWRPTGAKNRKLLLLGVLPYMLLKAEQAKLALLYLELHYTKDNATREILYLQSRELNRKGPETVTTNMLNSDSQSEKRESDLIGDYESDTQVTEIS